MTHTDTHDDTYDVNIDKGMQRVYLVLPVHCNDLSLTAHMARQLGIELLNAADDLKHKGRKAER
jgi:hypothetical protein